MKKVKYGQRLLSFAEEWITENGLILYGGAMLKEYAAAMGISIPGHYKWLATQPEYGEMIERAQEQYRQLHTRKLFHSLYDRAIGGYKDNEVEDTEYKPSPANPDKPVIARKKVHKERKYIPADTGAAIFLLSNLSPRDFVNRLKTEANVEAKVEPADNMTREEALKELERLRRLRESADSGDVNEGDNN